MKRLFIILLIGVIFSACNSGTSIDVEGAGVEHMVFLSLRPDLRPSEKRDFRSYLGDLKKIDGVLELSVQDRSDVGDERALNYDILMTVWLKDEAALKAYDQDSLHNEIRQVLYAYLDQAPATFDILD